MADTNLKATITLPEGSARIASDPGDPFVLLVVDERAMRVLTEAVQLHNANVANQTKG